VLRGCPEHSQILDPPYCDLGARRFQESTIEGCEGMGEATAFNPKFLIKKTFLVVGDTYETSR
jgi:hypothetical protein